MSRSYKKIPISKIKFYNGKKYANKKIRNSDIIPSNSKGLYKKYYPQYDICEWILYWPWEIALHWYKTHYNQYKEYHTEQEFYKYWYKCIKMK